MKDEEYIGSKWREEATRLAKEMWEQIQPRCPECKGFSESEDGLCDDCVSKLNRGAEAGNLGIEK